MMPPESDAWAMAMDTAMPVAITIAPTIKVQNGLLHESADEGESALLTYGAPFFTRAGMVVKPVVDTVSATKGRVSKAARVAQVRGDTMTDWLSRAAIWTKWSERKKGDVRIDPPTPVAATILSRDGEWRFPPLAAVITTPTLRPDGTILSEAGYDPATKLYLICPPALPSLPDQPTKEDAQTALRLLASLLAEFPFVDEASRSVALSALITPVVRGAVQVMPLHAISATAPGTGKSYIVDLASAISTGEPAPVMSAAERGEETEKRLHSALLAGQSIVSIDNVNGELGGDFLCQMVERPVVSIRVLGTNNVPKVETRASCFATGNNIQVVGDLTRRTVLCTLDADMERPETRTFKAKPFDQILASRGKYIAAALTIVRAYMVAGYPGELPALASFEDWSGRVRSALVWLGCVDPLETMEKARADDPVNAQIVGVLASWHDAVGSSVHTSGSIRELAVQNDPLGNLMHGSLKEALETVAEDRMKGICPRKLGRWLGRYAGRIVGGFKLTAGEDTHLKQKSWQVVRV